MPKYKMSIRMRLLRMSCDHLWKKQKHCLPQELETGDCWVALSLAHLSGLILTGRIGKHTDELAIELVVSTEGKTNCKEWHTDGWDGYERMLPDEMTIMLVKC